MSMGFLWCYVIYSRILIIGETIGAEEKWLVRTAAGVLES